MRYDEMRLRSVISNITEMMFVALQVGLHPFWTLGWMRTLYCPKTPHDFTCKFCAEEQPSSFPNMQSPSGELKCIWLPCHFLPNIRRKAATCTTWHFSFSLKTFQNLTFHYSERGVPRNQKIPQNLQFLYANVTSLATLPGPTYIS